MTPAYGYRDAAVSGSVCSSPGPTIRMKPGTKYLLYLTNSVTPDPNDPKKTTTNLHTHGLHVSGDGNADNVLDRMLLAGLSGQGLAYNLVITSDHPPGTYWYHPHHHESTRSQVGGGAMGVLIIEEIGKDGVINPSIPTSVFTTNYQTWSQTNEKILFFVYAGASSSVPLLNGADLKASPRQTVSITANQWYRFRVAVATVYGTSTILTFPTTCTTFQVAQDGLWLSTVPWTAASSFYFTAASRIDIAVKCSAAKNTITWGLITAGVSNRLSVDILTTSGTDNGGSPFAADGISTWDPIRPAHMLDMRNISPVSVHNVKGAVSSIYWNDNTYSVNKIPQAKVLSYNQVYELRLTPNIGEYTHDHPLHLHVFPMQVVGVLENNVVVAKDCPGDNDFYYKLYQFYDTIKPRVNPTTEAKTCVVRIRTLGYGGRVPIHCHMLIHEDGGAMAWVLIDGGPAVTITNPVATAITLPAISSILSI